MNESGRRAPGARLAVPRTTAEAGGAMRKVKWHGVIHLATDEALAGFVRIVCNAVVLPLFSPRYWGMPDDTKLTCRACKAAEKRAAQERKS